MHNGYLPPSDYSRGGVSLRDWFSVVFLKQLVTEQRRQIEALKSQPSTRQFVGDGPHEAPPCNVYGRLALRDGICEITGYGPRRRSFQR